MYSPAPFFFCMSHALSHFQKFGNDASYKRLFVERSRFLDAVREYFREHRFIEVETPVMVKQPGLEPNLSLFQTSVVDRSGKKYPRYLITSPEHQMKMLLCAGFGNMFQICKCFRNQEEGGSLHNPEFSMLEWYRVDADYHDVMKDTEELFRFVCRKLHGGEKFSFRGKKIDLHSDWERISVRDAFRKYVQIDNVLVLSDADFNASAKRIGVSVSDSDSWDDIFYKIFLTKIEPNLGIDRPVFLYDYPAHMAALSKKRGDVCERFELYIGGIELANAFTELTDAKEQRARFAEELMVRAERGKDPLPMPEDFLKMLEKGMPECSGIALGLDRMFTVLMGLDCIHDALPFADFMDEALP